MPFKSEAQRKFMYKTNPKLAEKFDKIHNSKAYKKLRGRKRMMTNPGGGFAAAAARRLDAGKMTPPGLRKRQMASGRSIPISPGQGGVRKAQPITPGTRPMKSMPAFAAAARRKLATK